MAGLIENIKLILASGSPRRSEILKRHGFSFEVIKSSCDEDTELTEPAEVVLQLSERKASDVCRRLDASKEEYYVLAADTVVALDGVIYGKPSDENDAFRMIKSLQGKVHQVFTGVSVFRGSGEKLFSFADATFVTVYPMSDEEIWDYIKTGEPMDKAGAYAIQGLFAIYIEQFSGSYDNVVGLPVSRLYNEFKKVMD